MLVYFKVRRLCVAVLICCNDSRGTGAFQHFTWSGLDSRKIALVLWVFSRSSYMSKCFERFRFHTSLSRDDCCSSFTTNFCIICCSVNFLINSYSFKSYLFIISFPSSVFFLAFHVWSNWSRFEGSKSWGSVFAMPWSVWMQKVLYVLQLHVYQFICYPNVFLRGQCPCLLVTI